jgi:flagellar biosynthetic protein FliR
MGGCIFLNPIIGRRNFSTLLKFGFSLVLTLVILSTSTPSIPEIGSYIEYIALLIKELFVGFVLGFVITLFSYVISFAGAVSDMQMSLSMSQVYDPQTNSQMTVSASFYNIMYMFLFFASYGHITLIRMFLLSDKIAPYGRMVVNSGLYKTILDLFSQCTVLAVKMAMPIIAIEVLLEMAIGILMKAIPQINIFVLNIQAKMFLGFLLMLMLFVPFSNFLEQLVTEMFRSMEIVLGLV